MCLLVLDTNVTLVGTVITDLRQRHTGEGARFVKFRMPATSAASTG